MPTVDHGDLPLELLVLLRAARETGALDALVESAGTPDSVAETSEIDRYAATVLVETLTDSGFLEPVGDEFELTNRGLGFLAKRDLRSIGRLPHALDRLDDYAALPETMETGRGAREDGDDRLRNRLGADAATPTATVRARVTAVVRAAPRAESVVDLRGQSGVHAREFAARGFDTTLVEAAGAVEAVRPLLEPTDVRVTTGEPLPEADLVFGVDLVARHADAEVDSLLDAAAAALDDGTLVLVEAVRGRSAAAPRVAVESLTTGGAGVRTADEHRQALAAAGFPTVDVRSVPGIDRVAVVAHRDRGHRGVD
jgi:hypothetical protein